MSTSTTCSNAGQFFELAAQRLGADPIDIVFVDDVEGNVDRATAAGWCAVVAPLDRVLKLAGS
jgi:HAD superfamily hydrolase (TIGR01509 family)